MAQEPTRTSPPSENGLSREILVVGGVIVLGAIMSILAGVSWSLGALIFFRVVQGVGGGLIIPVGQTILAQAAGPKRMGRVMSIVGIPMLLAPVFGPVIGGVLVDQASWRWIFFINLPVGALALLLAARLLPAAPPQPTERLDLRGLVLLPPGIALFVYGLAEVGRRGGFGDTTTLVTLALGLVLLGFFVPHASRRGSSALLDIGLFRSRGFATASASSCRPESRSRWSALSASRKSAPRRPICCWPARSSSSDSGSAARSCRRWRSPSRPSPVRRSRRRRARSTSSNAWPARSARRCSPSSCSAQSRRAYPASTAGSAQSQHCRTTGARTPPPRWRRPSRRASGWRSSWSQAHSSRRSSCRASVRLLPAAPSMGTLLFGQPDF